MKRDVKTAIYALISGVCIAELIGGAMGFAELGTWFSAALGFLAFAGVAALTIGRRCEPDEQN